MAILGIKTWKMENIAENDRKEGIRTRQGFGELKMLHFCEFNFKMHGNLVICNLECFKKSIMAQNDIKCQNKSVKIIILQAGRHFLM